MTGKMVKRRLGKQLVDSIKFFPVSAIVGPRQVGKSTLAQHLLSTIPSSLYLDLERPSDLAKLDNPEVYMEAQRGRLICFDEIQRRPDLFPILRSVVDESGKPGQFLILGSASPDLLKQSSESLAGRIDYMELTPFLVTEVKGDFFKYWLRGGYPDAYLAPDDTLSFRWQENFVATFLERDIPALGIQIPTANLRRFWQMCAHYHGQVVNFLKIGQSLALSHTAIRRYTEIMAQTYMIRLLQPYHSNLKKRLVKTPKLYVRDSGILHRLLGISSFDDLAGHPVYGASFEGIVIENVLAHLPDWEAHFYKTQAGAEIDLLLTKGNQKIAIECKATKAPAVSKGFFSICDELGISNRYVISLVDSQYEVKGGTIVCSLKWFLENFDSRSD